VEEQAGIVVPFGMVWVSGTVVFFCSMVFSVVVILMIAAISDDGGVFSVDSGGADRRWRRWRQRRQAAGLSVGVIGRLTYCKIHTRLRYVFLGTAIAVMLLLPQAYLPFAYLPIPAFACRTYTAMSTSVTMTVFVAAIHLGGNDGRVKTGRLVVNGGADGVVNTGVVTVVLAGDDVSLMRNDAEYFDKTPSSCLNGRRGVGCLAGRHS